MVVVSSERGREGERESVRDGRARHTRHAPRKLVTHSPAPHRASCVHSPGAAADAPCSEPRCSEAWRCAPACARRRPCWPRAPFRARANERARDECAACLRRPSWRCVPAHRIRVYVPVRRSELLFAQRLRCRDRARTRVLRVARRWDGLNATRCLPESLQRRSRRSRGVLRARARRGQRLCVFAALHARALQDAAPRASPRGRLAALYYHSRA